MSCLFLFMPGRCIFLALLKGFLLSLGSDEAAVKLAKLMGFFSSFVQNRKRILVFIVSLNILFSCLWIYQKQYPIKRAVIGELLDDQRITDVLATSRPSPFKLTEVNESDVKQWQEKFYKSLARLKKRSKHTWVVRHGLGVYNQSQLLNDTNQFKLPHDAESSESIKTDSRNGLLQFLDRASCKPISPDVVLYNRVYKTGSETAGALFRFVGAMMDYDYTRRKYRKI